METAKPVVSDAMKTIVSSLMNFNSMDKNSEVISPQTKLLEKIYKLLVNKEEEKSLMAEIEQKQHQLEEINENRRHRELIKAIEQKNAEADATAKRIEKEQNKLENEGGTKSQSLPPGSGTAEQTKPKDTKTRKSKTVEKPAKAQKSAVRTKVTRKKAPTPRKVTTPKGKMGVAGAAARASVPSKRESIFSKFNFPMFGAGITSAAITTLPSPDNTYTEADLIKRGFQINLGRTQKEGAYISPQVISAADILKNTMPGIKFTGFNDQFHTEKAPNSVHTQGLAFDFTVPADLAQNDEERKKFAENLAKQTGGKVIDEYASPSAHSTGGHFHVQFTGQKGVDLGSGKYAGKGSETVPAMVPGPQTPSEKVSEATKQNKDLKADIQSPTKQTSNTPAVTPPIDVTSSNPTQRNKATYIPPPIVDKAIGATG